MLVERAGLVSPSTIRSLPLTDDELALLRRVFVGEFGQAGVIYSRPGRRVPTQRSLALLAGMGAVQFINGRAAGWDRGMWRASLTCAGSNALFRRFTSAAPSGPPMDGHPGCGGGWLPDGTCTDCRVDRPLDIAAYESYIANLSGDARAEQVSGPQLFCVEHGYLRRRHITTQKVCRLIGTEAHDGALIRTGRSWALPD